MVVTLEERVPDFLESKLRSEYGDNDSAVYGTMNNIGAMHGNKITAKGRAMERKHDSKIPKRMAAGGVVGIPNWQSLDEPDPEISPLERAALLAKQQQEQQQVQQPGIAPAPQPPQPPPAPQSAPDPSSQPQADPALDESPNDAPGASATVDPSAIPPANAAPAPIIPPDNRQQEASSAADLGPPMPEIPGHRDGQLGSIPPRSIPSPVGSIGSGDAQQAQRQAAQYYRNDSFKPGTNTPIGIPIWKQALSAAIPRIAPMLMHNPNKLDQNLGAITTLAKSEEQQQQALSGEEQKKAQTEAYRAWHDEANANKLAALKPAMTVKDRYLQAMEIPNMTTERAQQWALNPGKLDILGSKPPKENPNQWNADSLNPDPAISGPANKKIANWKDMNKTPVVNPGAMPSEEALNQAADKYNSTGQLPAMGFGRDAAIARTAIMNKAAERHPDANMAANIATFGADKESLKSLQRISDQVSSFEKTARKNLDVFMEEARKAVDVGVVPLNHVFRGGARALGNTNAASFEAARTIAYNEVAKVLSSSNANAMLTNEARGEANKVLNGDYTIPELISVANILKRDMDNRKASNDDMINEVKARMAKQPNAPGAVTPGGAATGPVVVNGMSFPDQASADKAVAKLNASKKKP